MHYFAGHLATHMLFVLRSLFDLNPLNPVDGLELAIQTKKRTVLIRWGRKKIFK